MLPEGSVTAGVRKELVDDLLFPLVKTALGEESGLVAVVANSGGGEVPDCSVVQPEGNAGAVTVSKLSSNGVPTRPTSTPNGSKVDPPPA